MFEKADAEFAELSQKKQILHLDKDKIEKVSLQLIANHLCPVRPHKNVDQETSKSVACSSATHGGFASHREP